MLAGAGLQHEQLVELATPMLQHLPPGDDAADIEPASRCNDWLLVALPLPQTHLQLQPLSPAVRSQEPFLPHCQQALTVLHCAAAAIGACAGMSVRTCCCPVPALRPISYLLLSTRAAGETSRCGACL